MIFADYWFWIVWGGLLATLFAISSILEKHAAMRGSHREPMPMWADKGLRIFFLMLFLWPLVAVLSFWPVAVLYVLYLPWYLDGSEKRGRMTPWLQGNFIFRWLTNYFDCDYESENGYVLKKGKAYVIGIHPHGLLPVASMLNVLSTTTRMHNEFFRNTKIRVLAASFCHFVPLYRDLLVGGGVVDAARYNARRVLDEGYSLGLVPGGATEALYAMPGRHAVYIKARRGFIKLAMETGSALVPCYSFGECELYGQISESWPMVQKFQRSFQRVFGISLPLVTNIFPRKTKIVTVAAEPIEVAKNPKPTDEQIDVVLNKYIASLQRVFDKFAPKYIADASPRKLEIH
jgi:hypothetical protein